MIGEEPCLCHLDIEVPRRQEEFKNISRLLDVFLKTGEKK
jgi:hypothetical protein